MGRVIRRTKEEDIIWCRREVRKNIRQRCTRSKKISAL